MFRSFLLLALMGASPSTLAQTVEGTVTSGRETVPFATIRVVDTALGVAADANGRFKLRLPEPGTFSLVVSSLGYTSVTREATVKPGHDAGTQGRSTRRSPPSMRSPSTLSSATRYIQPALPVYHVQPPRPTCGATPYTSAAMTYGSAM